MTTKIKDNEYIHRSRLHAECLILKEEVEFLDRQQEGMVGAGRISRPPSCFVKR